MKLILGLQLAIALLGWILLWPIEGISDSTAFLLGALFWIPNLLLFHWVWRLLILKKNVALAVAVIVLKYPFLFLYVYLAVSVAKLSTVMFAMGAVTITFTGLVWAFVQKIQKNRDTENHGSL